MLGDVWGATRDEVARRYPCDDIVAAPTWQAWRAVTVGTAAADVWPWVTQIRFAPYSYDWIDNLGRRSPRRLVDAAEPVVGEPFTTAATRRLGRIVSVEAPRQLTGRIGGVHMSYVVEPRTEHSSRLLLKLVGRQGRWFGAPVVLGDLVMARRQLLNLKRLAEETASTERVGQRRDA